MEDPIWIREARRAREAADKASTAAWQATRAAQAAQDAAAEAENAAARISCSVHLLSDRSANLRCTRNRPS
jgi:hypothetical protein